MAMYLTVFNMDNSVRARLAPAEPAETLVYADAANGGGLARLNLLDAEVDITDI